MVYKTISERIGHTPLVELIKFERAHGLTAKIFAKLEGCNPAGSVKDRIALSMIEDAEQRGILKEGGVLIEPTSGNTGIALAAIGGMRGYHVVLVMPETMSAERRAIMKAYGAELVLTEGAKGMKGAIERARQLQKLTRGSVILGQFVNPANPAAHYRTTGPEIWEDTKGSVDCFVAGVGTGGTLTGVGRFLKEKDPSVKIVAVEPASSPVLSKGFAGAHRIQGIGAGFVPETLDKTVYDEVIAVKDEEAFAAGREIAREGFLAGVSSGAALHAAAEIAKRPENAGKTVVVLFPDGGEKYLSTPLFA